MRIRRGESYSPAPPTRRCGGHHGWFECALDTRLFVTDLLARVLDGVFEARTSYSTVIGSNAKQSVYRFSCIRINVSYKSFQSLLVKFTSSIFFCRKPSLICFSRVRVLCASSHSS